jgi:hypothetical protein
LLGPIFASATHGYETVDHFRIWRYRVKRSISIGHGANV